MEIIENTLHVAWALRWPLVAMAFAVLGGAYALAEMDRRALRDRVANLEAARDRLVARLIARSGR